jgi:hypothetical protein
MPPAYTDNEGMIAYITKIADLFNCHIEYVIPILGRIISMASIEKTPLREYVYSRWDDNLRDEYWEGLHDNVRPTFGGIVTRLSKRELDKK